MRRCGVAVLVFSFALAQLLSAQETSELETGLKPFGSFQGGDIDSVSLSSGNLVLHIPLISYPQRGGMLRVSYFLLVNAKNWYPKFNDVASPPFWQWTSSYKSAAGVALALDQPIKLLVRQTRDAGDPEIILSTDYYAQTADGATHELRSTKESPFQGDPPLEFQTIDSSGIKYFHQGAMDHAGVIVGRDGVRYTLDSGWEGSTTVPVDKVEDPNGNFYTINNLLVVTDTLGRVIGTLTNIPTTPCPAGSTTAWKRTFPAFEGSNADIIFCYTSMTFNSSFGTSTIRGGLSTQNVLTAVLLPNQTKWLFSYNGSGELASITLPTGGTISYTWQVRGSEFQASRWVQSRTVNDGSGNKTWDYIWGGNPGDTVVTHIVRDPADANGVRNEHAHTFTKFSDAGYFEIRGQDFRGSVAGGVLLKTVNTALGGGVNGAWGIAPQKVTTIWPNGKVTEVQRDYDSGVFSARWNANISYGNVIEERVFDYGQNTPGVVDLNPPTLGPLLRKTKTQYRALEATGTAYKDNNLVGLVSQVDVCGAADSCDGNPGNSSSQTKYAYDQSTPTAIAPTPSTLNTIPVGPRGNQTSVSQWSSKRAPPDFITTTNTFFNTGMLKSVQDPRTHTTNFDYSPTFWGAYLTQTSNALSQTSSIDYDFSTGLVKSTTDANGIVTKFDLYDSVFRLRRKKLAFGTAKETQIDYEFTDTIPAKVKATVPVAGSTTIQSEGEVDGLGRTRVTRLLTDPQGTVFTRVQYDNLGRKLKAWNASRCDLDVNPSSCPGEGTFGVTTYEYDGLGRITKVIPSDGTSSTNNVSTNFNNFPTVEVTDQQGKKRRTTIDALGRIVQVDEPGTAVQP